MKKLIFASAIVTSLFFSSCVNVKVSKGDTVNEANKAPIAVREYSVQSVMWQQNAAEWRALCYQAFNIAKFRLDEAIKTTENQGKKFAIITDIDETVLDNSPYNAKLIQKNEEHTSEEWDRWSALQNARAIPGSQEFLKYANSQGIEIFYVSNRHQREMEWTIRNMVKVGFPFADERHLLLRSESSSKETRFDKVRESHTVLLYLGDNLSDFGEVYRSPSTDKRNHAADLMEDNWGKNFIVLPNPMYGDWEMKGIYKGKYDWSEVEKDSIRKASLRTYK